MKRIIAIILALLAATCANAQEKPREETQEEDTLRPKRAWEFGIGASIYQFNRMPSVHFTPTEGSNIVDLKLHQVVYTGQIYVARELSNVFALDFQGGLGKIENKWLTHLGLGFQWRLGHYFKSPWIDPYLRLGAGYMYKGYKTAYTGETPDGVKYEWWNVSNRDGADAKSVIPLSAGVGVNMWLNDYFGIGLAGDYHYILKNKVANPLQGTVRLLLRFGGASKRPQPVVTYVDRPVEKIVEKVVEKDTTIEKENVVENVVILNELLSSIYFDYNKYEIKPEYNKVLDDVKSLLIENTSNHYLLSGFTDSHGSAEYNLRLSERRVKAIRDALVKRGVPAKMLKTRGQGMKMANLPPSADNRARQGDRKVTIELITNQEYWDQL